MLMLEITMESQVGEKKMYVRRSFPVEKGVVDISEYGYPFSKYRKYEVYYVVGMPNEIKNGAEVYLEFNFAGSNYKAFLNRFFTITKEHDTGYIDPYLKAHVQGPVETVYITFYLHVD